MLAHHCCQRLPNLSAPNANPYALNPKVLALNIGLGRRSAAIAASLGITLLLLLLLMLTFAPVEEPQVQGERTNVVAIESPSITPPEAEPQPQAEPQDQPPATAPTPRPPSDRPIPTATAEPAPAPPIPPSPVPPLAPSAPAAPTPPANAPVYGPPNKGSSASRDTPRVGTAPNGEPLYAASWYREPSHGELSGYLSTASGPGWGLIACRTAPDFRVEDCVALEEYPHGSQINRAILAAAWQFRVRPPRLGGRSMVGTWVRIRIDYSNNRR